jgi:hypothetical protein
LILLVVVRAILYKSRRYKQYLQLEFKQSKNPSIYSFFHLHEDFLVVASIPLQFLPHSLFSCASGFEEFDVKPTIFSYNELRAATRDFHSDMKLGQGSYGAVYKVWNMFD